MWGWVWPATAAAFTVASGPRKHGMAWAVGTIAVPLVFAPFLEAGDGDPAALGFEVLWMALVLAAAGAYRNWRGWQAETAARVAQEVRGKAMADLRWMVEVLREQQPLVPQGDLSGLEELIQGTKGKVLIDFDLKGEPDAVPAPVALAVYRIVQEALTNVVQHARASRAEVRLTIGEESVAVEIVDDGHGPAPRQASPGHGIAGMRERVTALGGALTAGPAAGGGFRVAAQILVRP